ncbi:Regulator of G-protein signaling 3 [Lamellibrachia satsuma]|nr:Regulator of G-protein signaling 3 [Lamellibrachia satsuma]
MYVLCALGLRYIAIRVRNRTLVSEVNTGCGAFRVRGERPASTPVCCSDITVVMKTPHKLMFAQIPSALYKTNIIQPTISLNSFPPKVAASLPSVLTSSGKCHKRKSPARVGTRRGKEGGRKITVERGVRNATSDPAVTWDSAVALCDIFSYGGCCCQWDRERRRNKRRLQRENREEDVLESTRIEEPHPAETMENFEGVPMLEICERPVVWTGEVTPSMFQAYKGQLKLRAYINCGHLTVHVKKAKHLTSKWGSTCNAFVKVSIMPRSQRHARCRTDVVGETNHPVYDEKFSFETLNLDASTRIIVSVWNRDSNKNCTELLGCMSFGTENIITEKNDVRGWYYLLSDTVGASKHLRVINHQKEPHVSSKPCWMDSQTVSITRQGSAGYGFRVAGHSSAEVSNVAPGSVAELAGLRVGDRILRVNGFYTMTSSSDAVARIIKSCLRHISLEVQRPTPVDRWDASPRKPAALRCSSNSDVSSVASSDRDFYHQCVRKLMDGMMR